MSDPRYRTKAWQQRRAWQLGEEPLCRMCAARGVTRAATVADHVIPHRGDAELFWIGDLQSLCATCHSSTKQSIERTGRMPGCDINGVPADPSHPWSRPDATR